MARSSLRSALAAEDVSDPGHTLTKAPAGQSLQKLNH